MAIIEKETKNYLKILTENCVFEKNSVRLFVLVFDSKKARDDYYKRKEEVEVLHSQYFERKTEIDNNYKNYVSTITNPTAQDIVQNMPNELKQQMEHFSMLEKKFFEYYFRGYIVGITNWEVLKEIGFTKSMSIAIKDPVSRIIDIGPYSGQTFEPRCLYQQLKKLYPWDAIEDI